LIVFLSNEYADDNYDDDHCDAAVDAVTAADDDNDDVVLMQAAVSSVVQTVAVCSLTGDVTVSMTVMTTVMKVTAVRWIFFFQTCRIF